MKKFLQFIGKYKLVTSVILAGAISVPVLAAIDSSIQFTPEEPTVTIARQETEVDTKNIAKAENQETKQVIPVSQNSVSVAEPTAEQNRPNPYPEGTALWHVFNRRTEVGKVAGAWGSAHSWYYAAHQSGIAIDDKPQYGDIYIAGAGVFFVESVAGNSFTASTILPYETTPTTVNTEMQSDRRYLFIH